MGDLIPVRSAKMPETLFSHIQLLILIYITCTPLWTNFENKD